MIVLDLGLQNNSNNQVSKETDDARDSEIDGVSNNDGASRLLSLTDDVMHLAIRFLFTCEKGKYNAEHVKVCNNHYGML